VWGKSCSFWRIT